MEEELHVETEQDDELRLVQPWSERPPKQIEPLPPRVLRKYPLLQCRNDYETRAIRNWLEVIRLVPKHIQNFYRLRYNYNNQTVIFPLTDSRGNIFLLRERMRKEKRIWTVNPELAGYPDMDFPRLRDVGVWFGMETINRRKPVLLVEGEIDVMRLAALGFLNSLGSATSSVTDAQIDAVLSPTIILGYDDDKAGNFARGRVIDRVRRTSNARLFDADWGLATRSDGKPCKDAGDLPDREQLLIVLSNLEPV